LTPSLTYEEALFVSYQLRQELDLTIEQALFGLCNHFTTELRVIEGHLCRYLCYIEDHLIY